MIVRVATKVAGRLHAVIGKQIISVPTVTVWVLGRPRLAGFTGNRNSFAANVSTSSRRHFALSYIYDNSVAAVKQWLTYKFGGPRTLCGLGVPITIAEALLQDWDPRTYA